jgi:hypothetical protein
VVAETGPRIDHQFIVIVRLIELSLMCVSEAKRVTIGFHVTINYAGRHHSYAHYAASVGNGIIVGVCR